QAHQVARAEAVEHGLRDAGVERVTHVLGGVEHVGQAQRDGQREGVVERAAVDAGDVDRAVARHVDRLGLAAQLAGVVLADAHAAAGLALEHLADVAHRLDRRIVGDVDVGRGQDGGVLRRGGRGPRWQAGRAGRAQTAGDQRPAPHARPSLPPSTGAAATARPEITPCGPKSTLVSWPARMSWMPVALPVAISSPARSGRPRRAERDSANAYAASRPPGRRVAPPSPTTTPSIRDTARMSASGTSSQPGISGPSTRPLLLPKSLTTTSGPSSLIVASGLLATSTPTNRSAGSRAASAGVQSVFPAGASARRRSTYSASIAPKPPSNTGKATPSAASTRLRAKIGPSRRSSPEPSRRSGAI